MSGNPSHLSIEGVVKRFQSGAAAAVDGVSLEIAAGEFFALLGPSGCGKTTLLRVLAGFERPDAGRILIDGEDMAEVPPYRRPVNMMFQSYALFPHMTVAENVGFGLRQDGLPKAARAARVAAMLDLVKLGALAKRKPQQLSGGERQRVALARALAQEPKLVLLDEPLAALDRKLREETRFELVRIQQRIGITFLMVTHDQEEAMSMASRIAVMSAGKVVQLGTPQEIYETPTSRFVADFIGGVNLLPGEVIGSEGGRLFVASAEAGGTILVEHGPLAAGTLVTLAVRPEKIILDAPPSVPNRLEGVIRGFAYRGETSIFEVELATGRVLRASVTNKARTREMHALSDQVTLGWDPTAVVVLTI
jgi:putrescine transport system ATP-binding protein